MMLSTLFSYGFRPFFLAVGVYAPLILILWIGYIALGWPITLPAEAALWHAHEMIFGVVAAALAGFILTAMTNWTGARPLRGWPLAGLFGLWLVGRLAFFAFDQLPALLAAVIELSFLPVLGGYVAYVLIRARNYRNLVFLVIFAVLTLTNALFLLAMRGGLAEWAGNPQTLALDAVLFMVALVAGRIVPAFTRNWLQCQGRTVAIPVMATLDKAAVLSLALVLLVDAVNPAGWPALAVTGAAALLHSLRITRWQGYRTWSDALVWVLHLGYALLVLSLWLKHLALWGDFVPEAAWSHTAGIGAAAVMILAVMSRAGLGHTGRALVAPCGMGLAYGALAVAALARVAAAFNLLDAYTVWLMIAAVAWILGFAIFLWRYAPMLLQPARR